MHVEGVCEDVLMEWCVWSKQKNQAVSSAGKTTLTPIVRTKCMQEDPHLFFLEREEAQTWCRMLLPKKRFAKRRVRWIGCATALEKPPEGSTSWERRKISGPLGLRIALASQSPNLCRVVASCAGVCADRVHCPIQVMALVAGGPWSALVSALDASLALFLADQSAAPLLFLLPSSALAGAWPCLALT